jgi:three-Cys-motif partner protein
MSSPKSVSLQLPERLYPLFPNLPPSEADKVRRYKRIGQPIWTEHKAQFIQAYLRYFVQITRHGAYIDAFAGPQYPDRLDAWAASLVLSSEPKWLRRFYLCEIRRESVAALRKMVKGQPPTVSKSGRRLPRTIEIIPGDFNEKVEGILGSRAITQKEATFCLLDQRMFECHWETVVKLSRYKRPPHNKIELLYFLGVGWLHRSFSGLKDQEKALKWWGRDDWNKLHTLTCWEIAELTKRRFEEELGYRFAAAYPIYDRENGNRVMYYMIHASDHEEAPALMVRAHAKAVRGVPKEKQMFFPGMSTGRAADVHLR